MELAADAPTYTRTSTSSYAYDELKALLLRGDVPLGVRVREEPLAARFGVSRTPVREALLRLFAEGFLARHADGGYRVPAPSTQTMANLYEVRRALELFAVRRRDSSGAPSHDREALHAIRREWIRLGDDATPDDPEFVVLDEDFHAELTEASGNTELSEQVRLINQRIRPVRSHDFVTSGRIASTIGQHVAIVDALLSGQSELAADRLDHHIRQSQAIVEAASIRAMERMLRAGEEAW